jgi:uncharacterized membrane protein YoaK (UPF0700 family)
MSGFPTWEGLLLSGVAGAVDGIGYVLLHVFTAHITGNTVHVGTDAGRLDLAAAWRPALAIAAFVTGVGVGALTREACERHAIAARPVVVGVTGLLLVIFLALGIGDDANSSSVRFVALTLPAAMAMGCQNAIMPRIAGRRVKTYITGTMTEFAEAVVAAATTSGQERGRSVRSAVELFGLWFTYLVGGVVSGAAGTRWGVAAALFPIAGVAVVVCVEAWQGHAGAWADPRRLP